jgi:hypothetical protein
MKYYKAAVYMDNQAIPVSKREEQLDRFLIIINNLNALIKEMNAAGIKYTQNEITGGFQIVERGEAS